jgi:hypothetical protein
VDELVEQHFDALLVVAEHPRDRRVPATRTVMVGAEHVDRPVEAAVELVRQVDDVGGAVGRRSPPLRRADQHAVVVVAVGRGARPDGAVLLVGVQSREVFGQALLELALQHPRIEVDAEALEARLDLFQHPGNRIVVARGELGDVVAPVAVLGRLLAAPDSLDRGVEALQLRAGVVVVVLARDLVARELELARDRVADRAVPARGDGDRPGRVGRDHLDLQRLRALAEPPP